MMISAPSTFIAALTLVLLFFSSVLCADNLIPNPEFLTPEGAVRSPFFWHHGSSDIGGVTKSEFSVGPVGSPPLRALGIKGGEDRSGRWWCGLEGLERGKRYRISFRVYREGFTEGVFPEVELFGSRIRMSNLLTFGAWQDFGLVFIAPGESTALKFINDHPVTFSFSSPVLERIADEEGAAGMTPGARYRPLMPYSFPLVAYGAKVETFPFIKELGFNGVVIPVNEHNAREVLDAALRADINIVAGVDDDGVVQRLADSGSMLGWYVEDEPEGRSVPAEEIMKKVKKIRASGSTRPSFMAMVRPEFVSTYKDAADIILMDQYPVPNNPLIWLSKSMDDARHAGAGDVWAVIQIFGGQGWKGKGWDRAPSYDEMKAMSYLAVVHGARGLFFYTVKDGNYDLMLDPVHLEDVKRLIRELGFLSHYFSGEVSGTPGFFSDSLYVFAPDGSKPVHAKMFSSGKQTVVMAVNVLDKEVKGKLVGVGSDGAYFDEYSSGKRYVVKDGNIVDGFRPYEVKFYIAGKDFRKVRILDGKTGAVKRSFYAEVAASSFERTLGLMFRELPSEDRALLFMNGKGGDAWIHALNMRVPFDIIFFDGEQRVSAVHREVNPCTDRESCRHYGSPVPSRLVLETRAGVVERSRIVAGDTIELY